MADSLMDIDEEEIRNARGIHQIFIMMLLSVSKICKPINGMTEVSYFTVLFLSVRPFWVILGILQVSDCTKTRNCMYGFLSVLGVKLTILALCGCTCLYLANYFCIVFINFCKNIFYFSELCSFKLIIISVVLLFLYFYEVTLPNHKGFNSYSDET